MPTPVDRALQSRNAFIGFAGIVTAVAAWSIWSGDIFPAQPAEKSGDSDPDPAKWSVEKLRSWLSARDLKPDDDATREGMVKKVQARMKLDAQKS